MSKTVNNNVQPSVYAFYNAAQEAMSKNKASAVIFNVDVNGNSKLTQIGTVPQE